MATESEQVVDRFIAAWSRRNLEEIMTFFADDAVYHNIPMAPARGKEAIRAVINMFLPMARAVEFKVLNSASAGAIVFNERIDIFDMGAKRVELPVAGVFEVRGGKIAAWRDYFDLAAWTSQMS
ncbi:MAG TPA: limonene-1,2-epoxide hydrolase family protein [Candidatus Binataceae bacterium]|nr:limonene-1,2-epoxide hydrolase family protein [Candidatus Binataceae bacterium]